MYLGEGGRRRGPGLVQDVAGEVPAQGLQEGAAHVVQEVVVVRTVVLVAVAEALDQPIRTQETPFTKTHSHTHWGLPWDLHAGVGIILIVQSPHRLRDIW